MPSPNDRSRLAHALAAATGFSLVWIYKRLGDGLPPADKNKARTWARVVAREARANARRDARAAKVVGAGSGVRASCPQPAEAVQS